MTSGPFRCREVSPLPDEIAWHLVLESGHWNHSGWTTDSRDGALVCGCGTILRDGPAEVTA